MKILLCNLDQYHIERLIINSLEQALYQVLVVIDGEEHLLWLDQKKPVQERNLNKLRKSFDDLYVSETVLRHESPYDEMVGQAEKSHSNRLEVPLGGFGKIVH